MLTDKKNRQRITTGKESPTLAACQKPLGLIKHFEIWVRTLTPSFAPSSLTGKAM